MIHQYKLGGYNVVLDVCSGAVHVVDEVAYDIIGLFEAHSEEEILAAMQEQEKYKATKALAEQGDSRAVELLTEYDRRIEHKKQVASEREKAKRRAKRKVS